MESNDIAGVSPGIKSYEAFLLLAIKKEQWSEVNDVYETMQSTGVTPSQLSNYCKLLAAYKISGRDEAKTFLETLVATKGNIGREIQFLSLKIFFPDTFEETCDISNIVVTLRQYFLSNSQLSCEQAKKRRTDLLRSLQISTIEDQRQPTGGLNLESIKERREVAWRDVLVKLLAYE